MRSGTSSFSGWRPCNSNIPTQRLSALAEQAQERLAPHSRRTLHAYDMREFAKRLTAYNQQQADKQAQLELDLEAARIELETRRAAPTRDEILSSLSDDELIERFAKRLLSILPPDEVVSSFGPDTILACLPTPSIIAVAMGQLFSEYATHSKLMEQNLAVLGRVLAEMPTEKIHRQTQSAGTPAQLPKVLLVGFKPEQGGIIADRFHGRVKVETQDKKPQELRRHRGRHHRRPGEVRSANHDRPDTQGCEVVVSSGSPYRRPGNRGPRDRANSGQVRTWCEITSRFVGWTSESVP